MGHIARCRRSATLLGLVALAGALLLFARPAKADTLVVTNTSDNGPGSLRQNALDAASGDTVVFDSTVFSVPLTITLTGGQIEINKSLTIDGAAGGTVTPTISGSNAVRVFTVTSGVEVSLRWLRIADGACKDCDGGGIANQGTLTATYVTLANNSATSGGAVDNHGRLTLMLSSLLGNRALGWEGGAIRNAGSASISLSSVAWNVAMVQGGGVANDAGGILNVNGTWFHDNESGCGSGGGILNEGTSSIFSSLFTGNRGCVGGALNNVGAMGVVNSTLYNNIAQDSSGVANFGTLTVTHGTVSGNVSLSSPDGGIHNWGAAVLVLHNTIYNDIPLGPLGDYGGPVMTLPLPPGSLAIDSADDAYCPPADARGVPRPFGKHCDLGAYEAQSPYVVTNTLDAGLGSLRQIVADAAPGSTVFFSTDVFSVPLTITLSSGQIEITKSLTIDGAYGGVVTPTVSGNNADRILSVAEAVDVELIRLRLTLGNCLTAGCDGGAISSQGHLTITRGAVFSNTAASGGGIYNSGAGSVLVITGSEVISNDAGFGGGVYNAGRVEVLGSLIRGNSAIVGGGISNYQGHAVIRATIITDNGHRCCAGAGGVDNDGGVLEMSESLVSENGRSWQGGIANWSGVAILNDTTVLSNTGSKGGGIANTGLMTITHALVSGNDGFDGGGIQNGYGTMWLNDVQVSRNVAGETGAGILNWFWGEIHIVGSVIHENTSPGVAGFFSSYLAQISSTQIISNQSGGNGGGVLASGDLLIEQSVVAGNSASMSGGGILYGGPSCGRGESCMWRGTVQLVNTTISGNYSGGNGGGFASHDTTWDSSLGLPAILLTNTTIASNTAAGLGGGIFSAITGVITLTNVLIAENATGNCAGTDLTSGGHNLSDDATCTLTALGDITGTNAMIAPLNTTSWTHPLLPTSPAMNTGDNAACPPTDQRGISRPQGGTCDIGAYEVIFQPRYLPVIWR